MRTHNISKIGAALGLSIIICSVVRWFFMFYDPSQMILGSSTGAIVCIFAYQYNWMKNQEDEFKKVDKRLMAFTKWMGIKELE